MLVLIMGPTLPCSMAGGTCLARGQASVRIGCCYSYCHVPHCLWPEASLLFPVLCSVSSLSQHLPPLPGITVQTRKP